MKKERKIILSFSFIFVYLLSVQFEGILLNELLHKSFIASGYYMSVSMWSHAIGLILGLFLIDQQDKAVHILNLNYMVLILSILSFLGGYESSWYFFLATSGILSGLALVSFGYYFKSIHKKRRRQVIVYSLILSNILFTFVNFLQCTFNVRLSFLVLILFLSAGMVLLPNMDDEEMTILNPIDYVDHKPTFIKLWFFIFIVTIISGLMYGNINPSFNHLKVFSYTWVIPYILGLFFMLQKQDYLKVKYLNVGAFLILFSFIFYLMIPYDLLRYLVVDGLLLFGLGIFDYFWWGLISDLLDSTTKPHKIVGYILSANVLGILMGKNIGYWIDKLSISNSNLVIGLMVILFLVILMNTPLVKYLGLIFHDNTYDVDLLESLTKREEEVLKQLIKGVNNEAIANTLNISENTVKTHVRNILGKHGVKNRIELLSKYINHP